MPTVGGGQPLYPSSHGRTCGLTLYDLGDGANRIEAPAACLADNEESQPAGLLRDWRSRVLSIESSNEKYYQFFHQAVEDMAALRLQRDCRNQMLFIPAAGEAQPFRSCNRPRG